MVGWRSKAKETKAGEAAANGGTARVAPPDGQEGLAERDGRIAALERRNGELEQEQECLREENERLRAAVVQGETQVRELQARVGQNSRNSLRPSSTDPASVPRRALRRRGPRRQPGGQPGHPGHRFPLVPPEQVDHKVPCYPGHCGHCQAPLPASECAEVGVPLAYQVHDVEIRRRVTQCDQHRLLCPHCGESTLGALHSRGEGRALRAGTTLGRRRRSTRNTVRG